ncbi:phosphoesterase, PA-phosphatase related [Alkaliphilus metalliredigens QYMF]|uniref:Phosphoesterase, PA-phosphatase related n=1 Tax=Alkaliphilus metalliredigens (strain QYMF) TaxID=293826 RepID=A6TX74_ALKMQ|nr:vanadium-dependent haloperoxidase [Alkaliphilus metalliredigens]ABR50792.1 phosphoesterase, PA-phosphatase related [Alkaliphilus metalliredigens QYMF]
MKIVIRSNIAVEYLRFHNKNIKINKPNKGKVHKKAHKKWSCLPYAGETRKPIGIDPAAGSWPLYFMKRSRTGRFTTLDGKMIRLTIQHPDNIDFCKELSIVKRVLKNITCDQRKIAEYWGDGPPTKQWTPIIDRLVDTYNLSPAQSARVIAAVQAGMSDALVITWFYKYLWDVPRPNQLDSKLITAICTPKFPAYPSGHSVISGTAEVILSYFFPPEAERLKELAQENSISRLYGGVHFPSDLNEGLRLGRQIGMLIVDILKCQLDGNNNGIDRPSTQDLNARLHPHPYNQVIPYPSRVRSCNLPLLPE